MFWGTLWSQNSLLLHNEQDLSIAIPYRPKQVHLSRGVIRSITLVFWVGHLFQPFFIIVWMCWLLVLPTPWSQPVFQSLTQESLGSFHCHRVPDSFRLPLVMDSWKFEDHWTVRAPLVCSISGVFSSGRREVLGDFPGLCKILHETTPFVWNHMGSPSCIPVFFYFCRYRFVLAVLHVDDGSYWSTMGCDSFNVGLPGPAAAPRGSGRGLLSRPLVSPL